MFHKMQLTNYNYKYELDAEGQVQILLFTHPESLDLLQWFPEVLLLDCTYKTNWFKMPLLDILGSTGINTTFYTAFVFLASETQQDYETALKILWAVMEVKNISPPSVMVTDNDNTLMNAIKQVFPQFKNLLCAWHINTKVNDYCKRLGVYAKDTDEETSFMKEWRTVVSSVTVDDYDRNWTTFERKYSHHPLMLAYLQLT
jgi:hypothetical protein